MVDYSKWDKLELLSDDDDECHPNVDKASLHRWKKQAKVQKLEQEKADEAYERETLGKVQKDRKEMEQQLSTSDDPALKEKLAKDISELAKFEADLKASLDKRDRLRKFNEENACHDGFSKTVINKSKKESIIESTPLVEAQIKKSPLSSSSSSSSSSSKKTTTTTELIHDPSKIPAAAAAAVVQSSAPEKVGEIDPHFGVKRPTVDEEVKFREQLDSYVEKMEIVAHTLNLKKSYEEMYTYIGDHPEIVCEESVSYLLLHCSDAIKKGNFKESRQFLKTSQVVKYCMELGKDGIYLFFMRMRDPSGRFKHVFETELGSYWERIKEKILELEALRMKEKQQRQEELKKAGKAEEVGSTDDEYYDTVENEEEEEEEEEEE